MLRIFLAMVVLAFVASARAESAIVIAKDNSNALAVIQDDPVNSLPFGEGTAFYNMVNVAPVLVGSTLEKALECDEGRFKLVCKSTSLINSSVCTFIIKANENAKISFPDRTATYEIGSFIARRLFNYFLHSGLDPVSFTSRDGQMDMSP